ncbi:MAG: ImmA/IrrE family metallo-endopeptidase, partial [candidate division WOR-3 bacterium]
AEFLVPATKLQEIWPSVEQDPKRFQTIARQYKVSEIVVARRALDIELITKSVFFNFYRKYQNRECRAIQNQSKGGNFYRNHALRLGRRFVEAVIGAVMEGKLLYRDAYRLTGLYGKTFEKFVRYIDSGGPL